MRKENTTFIDIESQHQTVFGAGWLQHQHTLGEKKDFQSLCGWGNADGSRHAHSRQKPTLPTPILLTNRLSKAPASPRTDILWTALSISTNIATYPPLLLLWSRRHNTTRLYNKP